MIESRTLPVLLFAFAAEDSTIQVEEEARAIQSALADVSQQAKLCRIEIPPFLKLHDLVDAFQKNRDRVAVFHYAGHADGASLMLRTAQGLGVSHGGGANAAGMAKTVQGQSGLKLVFLNGCSTESQVSHWIAAGVQCVIATTQRVNGEVASNFAARFYKGLATGASIKVAYDEAVGEATAACGGKSRLVYADDEGDPALEADSGRWPWFLQAAPGAEAVLDWNLPDAAGDPLALLPLPINGPLPDAPYPGLRRFTAADAPVFFGRGHSIRRLYERVTSPTSAPVILLHGQSGVGKSSILEAGLTPRLQVSYNGSIPHEIVTIRIDPVRGLLDSLRLAYIEDACREDGTLCSGREAWCQKEARLQQPVIVILDQLEEAFTHATGAVPTDWDLFLRELCLIFNDRTKAPKGKLILSFRTEWFSRINSRLQGLWKSEVFLDCLDADGIHEAIEGPTRRPELREYYPLTIQPGLSLRIATELLMDQVSSVAPSLQIVLQALWKDATRESRTPVFTEQLYRRHRTSLAEFVWTQMQTIASAPSVTPTTRIAIRSGLLEDFLECHVTTDQTARHQSLRVLVNGDSSALPPIAPRYAEREAIIRELRQLCIDHYLLIQPDSGGASEVEISSRLAHDALAPHIRTVYESSDAIGPRARRILEQRVRERSHGVNDELDRTALKSIERGQPGMRDWTQKESLVVAGGRKARLIRRGIYATAFIATLLLGYFIVQYGNSRELEIAFGTDAAGAEKLFELSRQSPRMASRIARRLLIEGGGESGTPVSDKTVYPELDVALRDEPQQDRRSVRAAMVLIKLNQGDERCYRRMMQRLRQIRHPGDEETAELQLIAEMTREQIQQAKDGKNTFDAKQQRAFIKEEVLKRLPATTHKNKSEPQHEFIALTAFLLQTGYADLIPPEWYEPRADQWVRTQIIAFLHQWLPPDDLLRLCTETVLPDSQLNSDAPAAQSATAHLHSVLSLAISASGEPYLRSCRIDYQGDDRLRKFITNRYLKTTSSALRSATRLLLTRLAQPGTDSVKMLEMLHAETRTSLPVSTRLKVRFLRPHEDIDQCEWVRVEIPGSEHPQNAGIDFVRIPAKEGSSLLDYWMSATEVPNEFFHQYDNLPDNVYEPMTKEKSFEPSAYDYEHGKPKTDVGDLLAMRFCNWLSMAAGVEPHYNIEIPRIPGEFVKNQPEPSVITGNPQRNLPGFRLPSDHEWEHACRANSGFERHHFGEFAKLGDRDILADYVWYVNNSQDEFKGDEIIKSCATRLPNGWGLFDMVGNASEWRINSLLKQRADPELQTGIRNLADAVSEGLSSPQNAASRKLASLLEPGYDSVMAPEGKCRLKLPPLSTPPERPAASKLGFRLVIDSIPMESLTMNP